MKKIKMLSLLVIALLFTSSVGYAEGFNFTNINYDSLYNLAQSRGYTINNNYNAPIKNDIGSNNNTSNNNNNSYVTTYNNRYGIVISGSNNNWNNNNVVLPVQPSKPSVPTVPSTPSLPKEPTVPTTPTVPTKPEPTKPTTPTQPTQPTAPAAGLSAEEMEVVRLTNIERQKAGLRPFTASSELSRVARAKSEDMGRKNYFSHTSPTYGSPFEMMKQFGIKYNTAGENIARGYLSAQSVVNGWMNSPGHRANILNPRFNTIGVGAYKTSNNTTYWTQMFTN